MATPRRTFGLPLLPIVVAGVILACGAAIGVGLWRLAPGGWRGSYSAAAPAAARSVTLVVSGDTAGFIVPCGCTANQSGGLLRRGSFVAGVRQHSDLVLVDVGGAPAGTSSYDRVKFEAILAGEMALGLTAHNLGGPEAALGPDYLQQVARQLGVPFISANLRNAQGQLVADAFRIVEAGGRRLALAGVLSARFETPPWRVSEPRQAVLDVLSAVRGKCDWLAVLAYVPEEELRALARELPEVDLIVGGPTGQSIPPTQVGPVLLASATNKGKFLLSLAAPDGPTQSAWSGRVVEITGEFADDAAQQDNLAAFRSRLGELDLAAQESGLAEAGVGHLPREYRFAGSKSCRECHAEDCQTWKESAHSRGWETLAGQGAHVDSYCQQCHTTGFGRPGGFVSAKRSPERFGVGCESCHGPAAAHRQDPQQRTPLVARDQCLHCHDRENSPQFDLTAYWDQIAHGVKDDSM